MSELLRMLRTKRSPQRSEPGSVGGADRPCCPGRFPQIAGLGNQARRNLLNGGLVQTRPTTGAPGDRFEREAERVARNLGASAGRSRGGGLSTRPLSTRRPVLDSATQEVVGPRSPGRPLDRATRAEMERGFGYDLGAVRIHDDAAAAGAVRRLGAEAFTVGTDIHFAEGGYAPATDYGRRLLAHELTHVVQQAAPAAEGNSLSRSARQYPMLRLHHAYSSIDIVDRGRMGGPEFYRIVSGDIDAISRSGMGGSLLSTIQRLSTSAQRPIYIYRLGGCGSGGARVIGHARRIHVPYVAEYSCPSDVSWWDPGTPNFIHLAHELIHALHFLDGSRSRNHGIEEWRTIGLADYSNETFSDNRLRCELGYPVRTSHSDDEQREIQRLCLQGYEMPACFGGVYLHPRWTTRPPSCLAFARTSLSGGP